MARKKIIRMIGMASILAGLAACADPAYVKPTRYDIRLMHMDTEKYFSSREVPACGEPISWQDVLVVVVALDEDIEAALAEQAGPVAGYSDRWYRYRSGDAERAQRAFAARGCDLVILTKEPISYRREADYPYTPYIGLRWGSRSR